LIAYAICSSVNRLFLMACPFLFKVNHAEIPTLDRYGFLGQGQSKLDVLYDGVSLKSSAQTLSLLVVRVANSGATSIRINDYDAVVPVGLEVSGNAQIREFNTSSSNSYLTPERIGARSKTSNSITFNPVILEPKDFFDVRLLIQLPVATTADFIPFGKIAGISNIQKTLIDPQMNRKSLFSESIEGREIVQAARLIVYPAFLIGIGILGFAIKEKIKNFFYRTKFSKDIVERAQLISSLYKELELNEKLPVTQMAIEAAKSYNLYGIIASWRLVKRYEGFSKEGRFNDDQMKVLLEEVARHQWSSPKLIELWKSMAWHDIETDLKKCDELCKRLVVADYFPSFYFRDEVEDLFERYRQVRIEGLKQQGLIL
jgi:hypothetical protein